MADTPVRPLLPFVTVDREVLADCRIFKVEKVHRRSQMSGQVHDYYCLDAPEWVNVVAITKNDELVLVRQERHGLEAFTIELPAGLVEPGEDPAVAALREMREETGFACAGVESLGAVHPNPAIQGNRCHVFLARDVERVGAQELDGREEIEVQVVPFPKVREMIRNGQITHSLVLAAICLYDLRTRG
jgi:8-oxo-dGTP pyrophosphatase MutT (NUDIX family)